WLSSFARRLPTNLSLPGRVGFARWRWAIPAHRSGPIKSIKRRLRAACAILDYSMKGAELLDLETRIAVLEEAAR
ncbi:MAG: hypothetical protein QGH97_16680, partial [Dehalococcoidia bacterium]|nr:hypothetical protein [Dehalococcoidia bacterium]